MSSIFVKYCPGCAQENPRQQPLCLGCGADLTMVPAEPRRDAAVPTPPADAAAPAATMPDTCDGPCCTLELVADPTIAFTVREGQAVGRTDASEVPLTEKVPDWQYISSRHALFTRRGTQWYVRHVGTTNYILVDGTQYAESLDIAIYDSTTLVLAKTAFQVRLSG